ncbi:MAG: transglutaminase-like domain-containing protein [Pirellulales bacterium]
MPPAFTSDVEFHKLLARRDDVDLVRLMLEYAADAYPGLDPAACLAELDRLGRLADERLSSRSTGQTLRERLAVISELLYADEGFRGNTDAYYDPRNSYLNEVLDRRLGIPISLGIVYLAVAARAGLAIHGVAAPGHFVLGCFERGETLYVDPFSLGTVLDRETCRSRIEQLLGEPGVLSDEHFRPATALQIGTRILRNLKAAHVMHSNWAAALKVQQRLALLLPGVADEGRDLGLMYLRTGEAVHALKLLEQYLAHCSAEQAQALKPYLRSARRMVAELN